MRPLIKSNTAFFIPYFIFLLAGILLIVLDSKAEKHIEINAFHSSFFDVFFFYITYLGDGFVAVLITIIFLFVRYWSALLVGISNILGTAITQTLKHTLFSEVVRPKKFFEGIHDLYYVPGVDNYLYNSFPSGHSTCAFALYLALALLTENKLLKFVCFLLAFLVAYSRIYLSQHFFEDVYAGSVIGVASVLIVWAILHRFVKNKMNS